MELPAWPKKRLRMKRSRGLIRHSLPRPPRPPLPQHRESLRLKDSLPHVPSKGHVGAKVQMLLPELLRGLAALFMSSLCTANLSTNIT